MNFRAILTILLIAGVVYAAIRREEILGALSRTSEGFLQKSRALRARPDDVPMAVSKLASVRGISTEEANAMFRKAIVDTQRYRITGTVLERVPVGHTLVKGNIWSSAGTIQTDQLYALFGHPQASTLKVGAVVDCSVWMVGPSLFARQDRSTITIEEVVFTDLPVTAAPMKKHWMEEKDRTSLDRKQEPGMRK
jgi:hypothetical protein